MRKRLLHYLTCPTCCGSLELDAKKVETRTYSDEWRTRIEERAKASGESPDQIWQEYSAEILQGSLRCGDCNVDYAIVDGIPRMLPPALRTDRLASMPNDQEVEDDFDQLQKANQRNYAFEWNVFSHQYDQWDAVYEESYVSEPPEFFENKLGLDAGCGMGRYTCAAVRRGAEMIGIDLSEAIEAAYRNGSDVPTFHAVQADIFHLPFRDHYFDFAQSLGVLHHTPDPEKALQSVVGKIRRGQNVFLMLYQTFEEHNKLKHWLLKVVNVMRSVTAKMPARMLYVALYLMVPAVLLTCYFPSWLLWHLPGTRRWSSKLPYNYEQYRNRRLRDFHMNLFDRFGNPVERRYSRAEMEGWMSRTFSKFEMRAKDGWLVSGRTPSNVSSKEAA